LHITDLEPLCRNHNNFLFISTLRRGCQTGLKPALTLDKLFHRLLRMLDTNFE